MHSTLTNFEIEDYNVFEQYVTDFVTGNEVSLNLKDYDGSKGENRICYAGEEDYYEN